MRAAPGTRADRECKLKLRAALERKPVAHSTREGTPQRSVAPLPHGHFGSPPALPEDSPSSKVSGMVRYERGWFAPFPLTLTLSLREREQRAPRTGKPAGLDCSPRREGFTLSPGERAGVRGKKPLYGAARSSAVWRAAKAAGLYCFERFTISSLQLCRRSSTGSPSAAFPGRQPRRGERRAPPSLPKQRGRPAITQAALAPATEPSISRRRTGRSSPETRRTWRCCHDRLRAHP
jgi:hypothetical protein